MYVTQSKSSSLQLSTGSYRQIIRSTGITGFAQSAQIILKIIANKFVAVLLGPAGIGTIGLLQSTIDLINSISGVGLGSSAVRDVAYAAATNDKKRIAVTITVLKRLCIITGFIGTLFTLLCAPLLSNWIFHTASYTNDFRLLSLVLLVVQITVGQQAILQGYRKLKEMAFSSIAGGTLALLLTVPLYFIYGTDAIVPVIIISSVIYLLAAIFFSRKIRPEKIELSVRDTFRNAKGMIGLGLVTMLSGLFIIISILQLRILIGNELGVYYVGIFQAGWGIESFYLQMLFQAMSRDYYPRLSAASDSPEQMKKLVNEQLHIGLLIAAPIIAVMLFLSPFLIHLMYSSEFYTAAGLLQWLMLGTLLKVIVWPVAFVLPAKRATKIYLLTEAVGSFGIWILAKLLIGRFGIDAVGIAYLLNYGFYMIMIFSITGKLISFRFDRFSILLILLTTGIIAIEFLFRSAENFTMISVITGILSSGFLIAWSFYHLNRLVGIKAAFAAKFKSAGSKG